MNYTLINTLLIIGVIVAVAAAMVLILRRASGRNDNRMITVIFVAIMLAGILLAVIPFGAAISTSRNEGVIDTYDSSIESAAAEGNLNRVKAFLEAGVDPDETYDTSEAFGYTPLTHACVGGYYDIAELLIEYGADVNTADFDGVTPLMYASMGDEEITKLLIKNGADISAVDYSGYTALHKAASTGNLNTAKLLIENGADVNAEARTKILPIQSACSIRGEASAELLEYLIKNGADTSVKDLNNRDLIELLNYTENNILKYIDDEEFDENDIIESYDKAREVLKKYIKSDVVYK